MKGSKKYDQILDALRELMEDRDIRSISVSEIAKKARIGKGSIYYYFPSKDALLDALVERSYQVSLETAKSLAARTDLSPFMRMALLFEACRSSSTEFLKREMMIESQNIEYSKETASAVQTEKREQSREQAHVHRKFLTYVISELRPVLTEIIQQGIDQNLLHFDDPAALAELVLIVLAVKLDNYLIPSAPQDTERTLRGLTTLLEAGTGIPRGTLDFLTIL